jgi:hypothetical protein
MNVSIKKKYTYEISSMTWPLLFIYLAGWILIPKVFFGTYLGFPNFHTFIGFGSFIILIIGLLALGKWSLILKSGNKENSSSKENGNGGPPPFPGERICFSILLIIISAIVYKLLINIDDNQLTLLNTIKECVPNSENSITILDRATLWSAVYGTIFGTLTYIKSK